MTDPYFISSVLIVGIKDVPLFQSEIGALNAARLRRSNRRQNIFDLGPCCRALSAKKDLIIRRKLRKSDKVSITILSRCFKVTVCYIILDKF